MGTSVSFAQGRTHCATGQSGNGHPDYARSTHAPQQPCMTPGDYPQLSADDCVAYIKFHATLPGVELDDSLLAVCTQLQGGSLSLARCTGPRSQ